MRDAAHFDFDEKWFGQQAVYRVSMGNFMFFTAMSIALVGVKYKSDKRDRYLHHGNYALKLGVWLLFTALPFLFPNGLVNAYSHMARVGSGFFLVIQMVILLDFVGMWNEAWVGNAEEDQRWYYALAAVTGGAYAASLTLIGLMYHWFHPAGAGGCSLNITLITVTLLLLLVATAVSLHPLAKQGSIFPASIIGLYAAYLSFSALSSEPKDYACNGLAQRLTASSGSTLAAGMLFTLAAVVYAAFRAGSNTSLFTLEGSEDGEGGGAAREQRTALLSEEGLAATSAGLDGLPVAPGEVEADRAARERATVGAGGTALDEFAPVTYNYAFFHLIFALASMYIAMLMTGWGAAAQDKDRIDIGWASVWVKSGAQWVTVALYCWTVIAPALFPDREF